MSGNENDVGEAKKSSRVVIRDWSMVDAKFGKRLEEAPEVVGKEAGWITPGEG